MWLVHIWWWLQHVTGIDDATGPAYSFWSGIGSDLGEITLIGMAIGWWKHNECHVDKCHKRGKYPFQHYKLCHRHHPNVPQKLTHLHIVKLHTTIKAQRKNK